MGTVSANIAAILDREWLAAWEDYELPVQPSYPIKIEIVYTTGRLESEAGYMQTFSRQSGPRYLYRGLQWNGLSATNKTLLMDFFDARSGSNEGFIWPVPGGGNRLVAVIGSSITCALVTAGTYTVGADFVGLVEV